MHDNQRPNRPAHNRTSGARKINRKPRERLLSDAEIRFVYEGELKGQWFSIRDAMDLPVYSNPEYKVIRVEFRDVSDV